MSNHVGKDEFEIVDYKIGGYWPADWKGVFNGGRRLQHALYGHRKHEAGRTAAYTCLGAAE